jgi:hypothetical protein
MAKRGIQVLALMTATCVLLATLATAAAGGRPAGAQAQAASAAASQPVYTYVALWAVPRPDWGDIEKFYKDAQPALNKLVASGTLVGWGNARAWVHDASGFTHANWITATSLADIDRALKAIHDALPQPAAFSKAKHQDEVLRATIHHGKAGASGTGMLWVAQYAVRTDQMDDFTQLFESGVKPMFEEQMAAGTVLAYWLSFHAVHTDAPGGVSIAYLLPDAAAIDRFQAALEAYQAKNPELASAIMNTMEYTAHRDSVYEVLSFGQK